MRTTVLMVAIALAAVSCTDKKPETTEQEPVEPKVTEVKPVEPETAEP